NQLRGMTVLFITIVAVKLVVLFDSVVFHSFWLLAVGFRLLAVGSWLLAVANSNRHFFSLLSSSFYLSPSPLFPNPKESRRNTVFLFTPALKGAKILSRFRKSWFPL